MMGLGGEPGARSRAVSWEHSSLSRVFCAEAVLEEGMGPGIAPALMPWVGTRHEDVTQRCFPLIYPTDINSTVGLTRCLLDRS